MVMLFAAMLPSAMRCHAALWRHWLSPYPSQPLAGLSPYSHCGGSHRTPCCCQCEPDGAVKPRHCCAGLPLRLHTHHFHDPPPCYLGMVPYVDWYLHMDVHIAFDFSTQSSLTTSPLLCALSTSPLLYAHRASPLLCTLRHHRVAGTLQYWKVVKKTNMPGTIYAQTTVYGGEVEHIRRISRGACAGGMG